MGRIWRQMFSRLHSLVNMVLEEHVVCTIFYVRPCMALRALFYRVLAFLLVLGGWVLGYLLVVFLLAVDC